MHSVRRSAGALVATVVFLAGCSTSGDGSRADDEATSTTSPSAPVTSPTTPALPAGVPTAPPERPEDEESVDGAQAFGKYVLEVYWYTQFSNDTSAILSIAPEKGSGYQCTPCNSAVVTAKEQSAKGLVMRPERPVRFEPGVAARQAGEYSARWTMVFPDATVIDRTTGEKATGYAHPREFRLPALVTMRWEAGRWELLGFLFEVDS